MNTKLSRQQRRALERAEKKKERKLTNIKSLANQHGDVEKIIMFTDGSITSPMHINPEQGILPRNENMTEWKRGWVPSNSSIEIAGRVIPGLIYYGKPPAAKNDIIKSRDLGCIYIDPTLEISDNNKDTISDLNSEEMSYDVLLPTERANYLDWLASGKDNLDYNHSYMVLYFMGLEWAYFRGNLHEDERHKIKEEMLRLFDLFGTGTHKNTLSNFVQYCMFENTEFLGFEEKQVFDLADRMMLYQIEGGINILNDTSLRGEHIYSVLLKLEIEQFENVRKSCPFVFEKHFLTKFSQKYPNGLKVTRPNEILINEYESENLEIYETNEAKYSGQLVPDISSSKDIENVVMELGEIVAEELKQYSEVIESNLPDLEEANLLDFLPTAISSSEEHLGDQIMRDWIVEKLKQPNKIKIIDIARILNFEELIELEIAQWYRIAIAFGRVGYGLAPFGCPYFHDFMGNVPVKIYKFETNADDQKNRSEKFLTGLYSMIIGFTFFQSEDSITKEQLSIIKNRVDAIEGLTSFELEQLTANFEIFQKTEIGYDYLHWFVKFLFDFDFEFIRETIKIYVKSDQSILVNQIKNIFLIYFLAEVDYYEIESDFKLTNKTKEKFTEAVNAIKSVQEKSKEMFAGDK